MPVLFPAFRLLALAGVVALAGCAMTGPSGAGPDSVVFTAPLTGRAQVPPNPSPGTGQVEARLNRETRVLSWTVTYSGLTGPATAAHFHGPAILGQNAPVTLPFAPPLTSPIRGQATLTEWQVKDLMAGTWYANIHTAAHPGGELRGQLAAPQR